MKKIVSATLFLIGFIVSASAIEYNANTIIFNGTFGIGTFSAGEHDGGSVFWGGSLSADWIPNGKIGLSYGIESGLLGGETQDTIIFGIPIIFRLGWHPSFIKTEKIDIFILGKIGWAFGIWGPHIDKYSNPNGIVGGINVGGAYFLNPLVGVYAELGYNYYGLARSSNHPEYPLGYGSGKFYASLGVSLKFDGHL
ncbi:hypothetical protein FACS1894137_18830 [Spirochaetia bacterium]|nr:hypothetical protein FACS1894137_18830 [Spirochaetia bacterium]